MVSEPRDSPAQARFRRLHVEGYRSFGAALTLDDLGPIVVVYGLNNAGKTNLLRAIALLAKLVDQPLARALDPAPEHQDLFFKRTGQDRWMFAQGRPQVVRIGCEIAPGNHRVAFEIERTGDAIRTSLLELVASGTDEAASALSSRQKYIDSLGVDRPDEEALRELARLEHLWLELRQALRVAWSGSWLPIPDETRAAFVQLGRAPDRGRRARAQRARSTFAKVVSGLPSEGALEDLTEPLPPDPAAPGKPRVREDVAWSSPDCLLPLDQLGSGAQTIFGMLATMALADATTLLVDEPEQHLNVIQQEGVLEMLRAAMSDGHFGQIFIATHSVKFAKSDLCLWQLERRAEVTAARRVNPPELSAYEARGEDGPRSDDSRLVAHDGSVELPAYVREALRIEPGQFVYFVRDDKSGFRIVSSAQMHEALGDE